MAKVTVKQIAKMMANLDYCMFTTIVAGGNTASRPMSNNGDVKYDGTSYFFTWKQARTVKEITKNKSVSLAYVGRMNRQDLYLSVSGKATLSTDREEMARHWNKDLEVWFEGGLDFPGLTLIKVKAKHIKFWQGEQSGELRL